MLRSLLLYLSRAKWAQRLVTSWGFARKSALRFSAGETEDDAMRAVAELNSQGILATLDHLGENTTSTADARQAVDDICSILDRIESSQVRSNVSIKLSQIGLLLDLEMCYAHLVQILERAVLRNNFIRIDMEDSAQTELTLQMFRRARENGYNNVGIVVQSYLYRTEEDVLQLMLAGELVRLVKGAYVEPPQVAYPRKKDVDDSFDRLTALLVAGSRQAGCPAVRADGRVPPLPAIATHDTRRITFARAAAAIAGLPRNAIEFQMLYGVRRDLQAQLAAEGYPVRVYVPYGAHWYPYYMRRLAERPANVLFILSSLLRELF